MTNVSVRAASGFALLAPLLLWLGLPGGGEFWPLLFIGLVPLLYISCCATIKQRLFWGLACGLCHFMLQLYWIVIVLGRYGGLPWFFSLPAFLLLALYMAIYFAVFAGIAGAIQQRWGNAIILYTLPAVWVGLDWLRAILFSGFPWMDLGYGFWQLPLAIQTVDLFGHYWITFVVVLINCLVFLFLQKGSKTKIFRHSLFIGAVVAIMLSYGKFRMQQLTDEFRDAQTVVIGIVQGNIDQSRKWSPDEQRGTVTTYLEESQKLIDEDKSPDLIVWPETALPFFPTRNPLFGQLQHFAEQNSVALLTGSPWFEVADYQTKNVDFYNSAFIVTPQGEYGDIYFKSHLVPFGEYVPLKKLLPFIAPLVEAVGDFSPGRVEKPLQSKAIRSGILICFESIFPEIARKWVDNEANLLVNLTNDAWYGRSSAPSQSMAMSVYRAVETRRSLIRSANTGISAFVDPLGRVTSSSDIFVTWARREKVELMDTVTVHSRWGYLFGPLCFISTLILIFFLIGSAAKQKRTR